MDPKMHLIFEPLRANLSAQGYTDIDLLDIIGTTTGTLGPVYGQAMSYHARDILSEAEAEDRDVDYSVVVAEIYRRTFFDITHAKAYGTAHIAESPDGPAILQRMVDNLIAHNTMDAAQIEAGSYHPAPAQQQ